MRFGSEFICSYDDAIPAKVCDDLVVLFNKIEHHADDVQNYSQGQNVLSKQIHLQNKLEEKHVTHDDKRLLQEAMQLIFSSLDNCINNIWIPSMKSNLPFFPFETFQNISSSGYELRKIHGKTHLHVDGAVGLTNTNTYRLASVNITLSDTEDELIFPTQNLTIKLKKGLVVFFPPYWMFSHESIYKGQPRYSIQTWLTKTFAGEGRQN